MAKRAKNVPTVNIDALIEVFDVVAEFEPTADQPLTVQEIAGELGDDLNADAFDLLDNLADAELIEFERGKVWISREGVTPANARDVATAALNGFEPKSEERKRLEYAVKVSESQDMDMSQAPEHSAKAPEKVSETPVQVAHAIAEARAVEAVTPKPKPLPEIDGLSQFIDAETGDMVYESRIERDGLALDAPEEVPPCPQGVNPNIWDHAHTAITAQGRAWAMRQVNAVLHNQSADAPF